MAPRGEWRAVSRQGGEFRGRGGKSAGEVTGSQLLLQLSRANLSVSCPQKRDKTKKFIIGNSLKLPNINIIYFIISSFISAIIYFKKKY